MFRHSFFLFLFILLLGMCSDIVVNEPSTLVVRPVASYSNQINTSSSTTVVVRPIETYTLPINSSQETSVIVRPITSYSNPINSSENTTIIVRPVSTYTLEIVSLNTSFCFSRCGAKIITSGTDVNHMSERLMNASLCYEYLREYLYTDIKNGTTLIFDRDFKQIDSFMLDYLLIEREAKIILDSKDLGVLGATLGTSSTANVIKRNKLTQGFSDTTIQFTGPSTQDANVDCLVGSDYCLFGFYAYSGISDKILFIDYSLLDNESVSLLFKNALVNWVCETGIRVLVKKCGVVLPNATVELYVDGTLVYTTITDENGIMEVNLPEGYYDMVVYWNNQTLIKNDVYFHK